MKVLLALDQTRNSDGPIRLLQNMTWPPDSDLYLLHVNALPQNLSDLAKERILKISQRVEEIQKEVVEQARLFLKKVEDKLDCREVHVHKLVKKGFPGEEILKTIQAKEVDLVVLGSRGYSKAAGMLLGSVSQWVLHEAPCSVMIVRKMPREKKRDRGMNILVATDGSPDSRAAVSFVKTLGLPPSSNLTILHVVQKHVYETERAFTADTDCEEDLQKLAEELLQIKGREGAKLLENARKALSEHGLTIHERLAYGNAGPEILKTARYMHADLIVMGSRGSTGIKRAFLGSVSNKVAHSATCAVAVIRHKPKSSLQPHH